MRYNNNENDDNNNDDHNLNHNVDNNIGIYNANEAPNNFVDDNHDVNGKKISKKVLEKRKQLHLQREADEKEYQRMMSVRPHGGSGVIGGTPINVKLTYIPHEMEILKTMQDLDIDYNDAKQFLISEKEIYCKEKNISIEKDQLRRARVNTLMNKQKEKELKKEIYEKAIKDKEEEKIRQHKEKCRQKGLLLLEKNKAINRKNQRIVELGREHRVMTRINQFDHNNDSNKSSSSGSSNIDSGNNEMETMHTPKYQLKMNVQLASSSSLKQSSLQPSSSCSYSSSLRKDALNDMPDKNDNDEDDGYDDDDDYKYEYDDDGNYYDVFNDVDDVVNNDDQKEDDEDNDDDDDDDDDDDYQLYNDQIKK